MSNKSLKDKSSGDGITSYRITSYLSLSQFTVNKAKGEEEQSEDPPDIYDDLYEEGVIVATDMDAPQARKQNQKGGKKNKTIKRGPSAVQKLKGQANKTKEVIANTFLYPFRMFAFYLDSFLENVALITQNFGAILSLAWKTMVNQIKDNPMFAGKEIEEDYDDIDHFSDIDVDEDGEPIEPENQVPEVDPNFTEDGFKKISFLDLHELNINFTDNKNNALFHFDVRKTQSYRPSPAIIDPLATKSALQAIYECAQRAKSIPPATEGPYANMPLDEVLNNITEVDLQAFLRYVKVYPGNYVGRNLKVSETFATWIVYGAPSPEET